MKGRFRHWFGLLLLRWSNRFLQAQQPAPDPTLTGDPEEPAPPGFWLARVRPNARRLVIRNPARKKSLPANDAVAAAGGPAPAARTRQPAVTDDDVPPAHWLADLQRVRNPESGDPDPPATGSADEARPSAVVADRSENDPSAVAPQEKPAGTRMHKSTSRVRPATGAEKPPYPAMPANGSADQPGTTAQPAARERPAARAAAVKPPPLRAPAAQDEPDSARPAEVPQRWMTRIRTRVQSLFRKPHTAATVVTPPAPDTGGLPHSVSNRSITPADDALTEQRISAPNRVARPPGSPPPRQSWVDLHVETGDDRPVRPASNTPVSDGEFPIAPVADGEFPGAPVHASFTVPVAHPRERATGRPALRVAPGEARRDVVDGPGSDSHSAVYTASVWPTLQPAARESAAQQTVQASRWPSLPEAIDEGIDSIADTARERATRILLIEARRQERIAKEQEGRLWNA